MRALCPRGFVIPEVIAADLQSARVKDPQFFPLWIANPQGRISLYYCLYYRKLCFVLGDL